MDFGIIGYGRMGRLYHKVLSSLNHNIKFVCDIKNVEVNTKFYTDFKKAIDEEKIEGLIISTTGPSHYSILQYAIEKGIKYIVCEKPFTSSVKQADEIIKRIDNTNIRLAVNYSRRFSQSYQSLKNDLQFKNIIGNPRSMMVSCGAGGLSAVGTHFFDLCSFLFEDKVESVYAVPINKKLPNPRGKEFEDPGGYVLLNLENETRTFIDMGDDLGLQPIIEIVGEYGRIIIDDVEDTIIIKSREITDLDKPKHLYGLPNPRIKKEIFNMGSLEVLIKELIKNLISNEELKSTANIARKSVEIYSAIRQSFDTAKPVFLPLHGEYYEKEFMVT